MDQLRIRCKREVDTSAKWIGFNRERDFNLLYVSYVVLRLTVLFLDFVHGSDHHFWLVIDCENDLYITQKLCYYTSVTPTLTNAAI